MLPAIAACHWSTVIGEVRIILLACGGTHESLATMVGPFLPFYAQAKENARTATPFWEIPLGAVSFAALLGARRYPLDGVSENAGAEE